jgi:hypothetical protein
MRRVLSDTITARLDHFLIKMHHYGFCIAIQSAGLAALTLTAARTGHTALANASA